MVLKIRQTIFANLLFCSPVLLSCTWPVRQYVFTPVSSGEYELNKNSQGQIDGYSSFFRGFVAENDQGVKMVSIPLDSLRLSVKYASEKEYSNGEEFVVKTLETTNEYWKDSEVFRYRRLEFSNVRAADYVISNIHARFDENMEWRHDLSNRQRGFQHYYFTFEVNGEKYGGDTSGYVECRDSNSIEINVVGESLEDGGKTKVSITCGLSRLYRYDESNEPIIK